MVGAPDRLLRLLVRCCHLNMLQQIRSNVVIVKRAARNLAMPIPSHTRHLKTVQVK
jgi:hypothetical protein